jgi:plastin-3
LDANGDGSLDLDELGTALDLVGLKMPMYKVRKLQEDYASSDANRDGKLDMEEFKSVRNVLIIYS